MPKGLYDKYVVSKTEGPTDPAASYFVLRLDTDPLAREAAKYYAIMVADNNPDLGHQLIDQIRLLETANETGAVGPMTLHGLGDEQDG